MTQRITQSYQNKLFVEQIFEQQREMSEVRAKVSSGVNVAKASDDAGKAGTISQFQNTLNRIDRHKERIVYAENLLNQQETVVSNAKDLMIRAKELASQTANEVYSPEQRRQLSTEVWALRDAMVSLANTRVLGRYIYGGTDDDDPPIDLSPIPYTNPPGASVDANRRYILDGETGFASSKTVNITDDETVDVTTGAGAAGRTFFQDSINALERFGRALEGYRTTPEVSNLAPDLGGDAYVFPADFHGQTSAIQNSIDQIQSATDLFTTELSSIGGRMNRITQAKQLLDTVKESVEVNRADIQDADIFELSSKLTSLQTSFQALLATGSQINRLSLLDFI